MRSSGTSSTALVADSSVAIPIPDLLAVPNASRLEQHSMSGVVRVRMPFGWAGMGSYSGRYLHRRLANAVAPGGTLLIVSHHHPDIQTAIRHNSNEEMYFTASGVADLLDAADWGVIAILPLSSASPSRGSPPVRSTRRVSGWRSPSRTSLVPPSRTCGITVARGVIPTSTSQKWTSTTSWSTWWRQTTNRRYAIELLKRNSQLKPSKILIFSD